MIKTLPWDSNFFGFKVGEIKLLSQPDWDKLEIDLKSKIANFKLIYFITAERLRIPDIILKKNNGKFINQKVFFQKKPEKLNHDIPDHIVKYDGGALTPELLNLTFVSGVFSRFRTDDSIPDGKFEELYSQWIKNSLSKLIADGVFVSTFEGKIKGMITYKNTHNTCNIGLIAVSESEQGKGIGKYLIKKVEEQAVEKGLQQFQVPTQSDNINACLFYQKLGFSPFQIRNYYHFWIK